MMKKRISAAVVVLVALNQIPAQAINADMFDHFEHRIPCRPQHETIRLMATPERDASGHLFLNEPKTPASRMAVGFDGMAKMRASKPMEKMDSVIRKSLVGTPISKQVMMYNEKGQATECLNYVPNPDGGWMYHSSYLYEYDDFGRTMARQYLVDGGSDDSVRYEYFYDDDTFYYNMQTVSLWGNDEWEPYQAVEYLYDANRNTVNETYSIWNDYDSSWYPALKIESSYDEQDRMTSWFQYARDNNGGWYGYNPEGNTDGQRFYYTPSGKDQLIVNFEWEDDAWLEYKHEAFTYDSNDNLIEDRFEYWNRELKDWSGNDKYGPANYTERNYRIVYDYDNDNRVVEMKVFNTNSKGEEKHNYTATNEYIELEDGSLLVKSTEYTTWKNTGKPELANVNETTYDPYGYLHRFLQYSYNIVPDVRINKTEDIRHFDEYGYFHGAEYYSFKQIEGDNTRYGDIKEEFLYPSDFDPSLGYETYSEGHRYLGTSFDSDDAWALSNSFYYTWYDGVLTSRIAKNVGADGSEVRCDGYENEFDFSTSSNNVVWWASNSIGQLMDRYKVLSSTQYYNYSDEDEWQNEFSRVDTFYYSVLGTVSTAVIESDGKTEVARYDISGRRLSGPAKGINIIVYTDGSSNKVVVTE